MSDFQPPGQNPPQSGGFGSPPPPPPPGGFPPAPPSGGYPPAPGYGAPPAYGQAPPGYVAYGQPFGGVLAPPNGLRKAAVALFWIAAVAQLLLGLVAYRRGTIADDILKRTKFAQDLDDANGAVGGALLIYVLLSIAAVIVLAVWSNKTVNNAKRRNPNVGASSGLAAGGWFIPLGNYWVPWQQLRTAAKGSGGNTSSLGLWQGTYIASAVLFLIGRIIVGGNVRIDDDNAVSKLHNQGLFFTLCGIMLLVAAFMAMRAMREIDRATSGQASS